jgi:hypothetical protein
MSKKIMESGIVGLIKSSKIIQVGIFVIMMALAYAIFDGSHISIWGFEVNASESMVEEVSMEEWDELPINHDTVWLDTFIHQEKQ